MPVVNIKQFASVAALNKAFPGRWLYVGRFNTYYRLPASVLANQKWPGFETMTKTERIERFRQWLWAKIQARDEEVLSELRQITEQTVIVCFCAPEPCHGEVIARAARYVRREGL
jgi:hypothetical protein